MATSQMITKLIKVSIFFDWRGFLIGGLFKLDKLAVGIVGRFLRHDGQAAPQGLDDAGDVVDVVGQFSSLDCGQFVGLIVGALCSFFDGDALMLSEFGDGAAGVVVHLPHEVFFFFVHIAFFIEVDI